jgi:hypothetical protein
MPPLPQAASIKATSEAVQPRGEVRVRVIAVCALRVHSDACERIEESPMERDRAVCLGRKWHLRK